MTQRRFQKHVEIKSVDGERRVATGAVLVPNRVDRQGDFERPETIREVAEDYMERRAEGDATQYPVQDGVMHAAFPSDAASIVESTVLDEAREVGGVEYPAGTWIVSRKYHDDELWGLVNDGVLGGFSIGGQVLGDAEYDEAPDDVTVPDGYPAERGVTELKQLRINEISDVDIPAVPDATYAMVKAADIKKNLVDEVADVDEFVELMAERGHKEADSRRVWEYIWTVRAKEATLERFYDGQTFDEKECVDTLTNEGYSEAEADRFCGTQYWDTKSMTDDTTDDGGEKTTTLEDNGETILRRFSRALQSVTGSTSDSAETTKDGRTLSAQSLADAKAIHDASESLIARQDDREAVRFTDDPDDSFDIAAYGDEGAEDSRSKEQPSEQAEDTDTTDKTMTEDTQSDLAEAVKTLDDRLESIEKELDDAADGEVEDADAEKSDEGADLVDTLETLTDKVDELDERVDTIGKQSGESQQLATTDDGGDDAAEKGIDSTDMMQKLGLPAGGD